MRDEETGQTYRTNPCRDVAFFLPQLVADVEMRVLNPAPPDLKRLQDAGVGLDELKAALASFMLFMDLAKDPALKSPFAAIKASGFSDRAVVAQHVVLEYYAMTCLGAFWAGIRSSVMDGECPPMLSTLKRRGLELLTELLQANGACVPPVDALEKAGICPVPYSQKS